MEYDLIFESENSLHEKPEKLSSDLVQIYVIHEDASPFVSDKLRRLVEVIVDLTLSYIISMAGVTTNIIMMAVFFKQGYKDSLGISMTAVAFWDLVKSVGGFIQRTSGPLHLFDPATAESWRNISIVVFQYLISFSCYVTSVLTAYVAVERCLCITWPLKVRSILTTKRSCLICVAISVSIFGCFSIMYGIYDITWELDPAYNRTVARYKYNRFSTNNTLLFEYYNISGIAWPAISLMVIGSATAVISFKIRQAAKFRNTFVQFQTTESEGKTAQRGTTRDRRVVKMLLVILVIYFIGMTPRVIVYIVKCSTYEFYFLRKYHNIFMTVTYVVVLFDLLNSTINLFIFLTMSTKFRKTFKDIFTLNCKKLTRAHNSFNMA